MTRKTSRFAGINREGESLLAQNAPRRSRGSEPVKQLAHLGEFSTQVDA